jgi:hypothetical protein
MANTADSDFDEDAALDALWETLAAPHARDIPKAEQDRQMKGHPPDVALEKWGPDLEDMAARELQGQ